MAAAFSVAAVGLDPGQQAVRKIQEEIDAPGVAEILKPMDYSFDNLPAALR
jgi:hypothetical protein